MSTSHTLHVYSSRCTACMDKGLRTSRSKLLSGPCGDQMSQAALLYLLLQGKILPRALSCLVKQCSLCAHQHRALCQRSGGQR